MNLDKLETGQSAEKDFEITKPMTTNRMGRPGADVFSTPALLEVMEDTCIQASDPYLPEGATTVGFAVDGLRHIAPTAIGGKVTIKAVLTEIDRNRLTYSIEANEGDKKIGVAIHKRAVISTDPDA
jgi:predicted thioesterase